MSSPYNISAGYSVSGRIPTSSAPPPIVHRERKAQPPRKPLARKRAPPDSEDDGEPRASPYSISNVAKRLIPTATGAPPVREIKKARVGGRTSNPQFVPHGMAYARAPTPRECMQAQFGAPPQWAAPPPSYAPEPVQEELEPPPPPLRFELPEDCAFTAGGDLSRSGVAVYHDSRMSNLTGSASFILSDLLGDIPSEVQLLHDTEWTEFPEIGEALKQAGGEENSMCLAVCHSQGVWAIGLAGQWKKRETIARLALCVALMERSENADKIFEQYPDFAEFCQAPVARKKKQPKKVAKPVSKKAAHPTRAPAPVVSRPAPVESGSLPRDVALWIRLPEDEPVPEQLEGLASEALVICTEGTKRKGLYSSADRVLSELLGDVEAEVQFHDDCNWALFPTVGAGLKEIAKNEECMCVAVCPSRMAWAVGVGMKGKSRYGAAKAAIAATIHLQAMALGEELPDLSESSAIMEFVSEAQAAKEMAGI